MISYRHGWRPASNLFEEIIVDNFAGGGGASMGIEEALGRGVDVAINHDRDAVAMHRANHPETLHLCQDVFHVDPEQATGGKPVGLAWFSPDCTYFSKARGAKPIRPRNAKRRDLAWVVIRWAKRVRPRVIMLENVEEFRQWGPLNEDGRPCPKRRGRTFQRWVGELRGCGYEVEWRELRACDYGAPTIRKRLFLIARCDGNPIVWPEVTHGDVQIQSRAAARRAGVRSGRSDRARHGAARQLRSEGRSIAAGEGDFAELRHHDEAIACASARRARAPDKLHLAVRGLKPFRTAAECIDWSIPCPSIFLTKEEARAIGVKRPLAAKTLERIARGVKRFVIDAAEPFIIAVNHGDSGGRREYPLNEPMRTVCASCRGGEALVVPYTVGAGGAVGDGRPRSAGEPLKTVMTHDRKSIVAAFLAKHFGGMVGCPVDQPLPTITARATQNQVIAAHLCHAYTSNVNGGNGDVASPLKTVVAGGQHHALVYSFLSAYYGNAFEAPLTAPTPTVTTKERFGLVTVNVNGEPHVIVDIGMRMLTPRELFRAQGFPDTYVIDRGVDENGGRMTLTKTTQVRMCGNSVCPPVVAAIVRANVPDLIRQEIAA